MKDIYPTEEELKKIEEWDFRKNSIQDFLTFLESIWWMPDWGFKLKGKRVLKLELHTGGWSGNESIMEAIEKNFVFWMVCWRQSNRGGHFYFKIPLKLFQKI